MLINSERKLTTAEGLPNRSWFKHQLYAPGFYTGYAAEDRARRSRSHRAKTMAAG